MNKQMGYLDSVLDRLKTLRENNKITETELEERMILGPGWVSRFESGTTVPSIDMLLAMLHEMGSSLPELFEGLPDHPETAEVERTIFAEPDGDNLTVFFRYANFDARYTLPNATLDQFEDVVKTMRDTLSRLATADEIAKEAIKTNAVANAFIRSVNTWPHANPSDLWWFLVYRAYCDPYNHPATYARLDFAQSWKRTGGWALEEVLVRHYGPFLRSNGVNLFIADRATTQAIVDNLDVGDRIEADKIDVVISNGKTGDFMGVVNVKASFAERRTDDVPMSNALSKAGYLSPLWTMDCKSMPSATPRNRGELGVAVGNRSAKRMDIEDEGYFTGCFSYNRNTNPTEAGVPVERRIQVCDFQNPDDAFTRFILSKL
ncbi:helix-turn-helix domain-containing protein [Roseovarius atlanticus]|uniref:helix-turn-helix domain-containing protein n=1 Tax=Roseovarius atlanticus TaxID=1641875 RepID=UPI001C9773C6|nr:helix-turn-helix domain-containing protein [Roseovarius atlanticus]MBY5986858.1 helix-turn-helix domain-containing protein [Roseovarius atlanticus]MBY6125498.1 helix-turn-helix domain-containing protein [Roseovarius atlanticus]MBY6150041.1 helix-turn-helix domain-containing protein [Roseovarius atlanticus]